MYLFESRPVIVAVVQTDEWFFGFSIFAGKWMNAGLYWGQGCIFKWGGRREMGGQLDYKQFLWFPLYIPQLSQILSGHARAEEWSLMAWRCLQALVTAGMCTRKLFFFFHWFTVTCQWECPCVYILRSFSGSGSPDREARLGFHL